MLPYLKSQWLIVSIVCASVLGYVYPEWGEVFQRYDIFSIGIFLAFFTTGLTLDTRDIFRQMKGVKTPFAAVFSSLILYPAIAWLMARPIFPYEFLVGICIIASGPVTVSSGTIMTAIARGNVPLSLLICVLTNFLAILTIPFMLNIMLNADAQIELPMLTMFLGLIIKVLVPIVLGQAIRPFAKRFIKRLGRQLSVFQSCIIILIIFNAVSRSAKDITQAGTSIISLVAFIIFLHFFMLLANYIMGSLLRLDHASITAFTIHTSQKTLTVAYVVWAGYFASSYPLAFIPAIVCQLTQMTVGTFITEYFRKRSVVK